MKSCIELKLIGSCLSYDCVWVHIILNLKKKELFDAISTKSKENLIYIEKRAPPIFIAENSIQNERIPNWTTCNLQNDVKKYLIY